MQGTILCGQNFVGSGQGTMPCLASRLGYFQAFGRLLRWDTSDDALVALSKISRRARASLSVGTRRATPHLR
jgi:hypothetical protein